LALLDPDPDPDLATHITADPDPNPDSKLSCPSLYGALFFPISAKMLNIWCKSANIRYFHVVRLSLSSFLIFCTFCIGTPIKFDRVKYCRHLYLCNALEYLRHILKGSSRGITLFKEKNEMSLFSF
jgi:hypothetical protein